MEETMPKKVGYVICDKTLKELKEIVSGEERYGTVDLAEFNIDRGEMSEEQKKIQKNNHWYKETSVELRVREPQIMEMAKNLLFSKILNKNNGDLKNEVYEEIYNTNVRLIASVDKEKDLGFSLIHTSSEMNGKDEYGTENSGKFIYSDNLKEFEEKLKDVKNRSSFSMRDTETVLLEQFKVYVRPYCFNEIDKVIKKLINKVIKNDLTYCLKNGRVIIPEDYLEKGEDGIKEWRDLKSSKNKNNSIEKRILRQTINEKKAYAFRSMCNVMDSVTSSTFLEWSIPYITIDGRWNKQRTTKLVNKVLDTKDPQYYIDTSEEELVNKFKEYWKKILMEAYNNVDKFTMKDAGNVQ